MRKRKKRMKNSEEFKPKESNLASQIKNIVKGLCYTSETDAKILPFNGKKAETSTAAELLNEIGKTGDTPVEEKDFNEFFAPLTEIQDWFGDEEKAMAQKFSALKDLLEKNLKGIKIYKVGKIQIDIYVVGLDAEGNLMGIQTKAVET